MNISQEEYRGRIYDVIKDKVFISNISGQMVDVVEKLPDHIVDEEVLFDGFIVYDGIEGVEDGVRHITSFTKDRVMVNVEDFYWENGVFEEDKKDCFIAALESLMTAKEFLKFLKIENPCHDEAYLQDEADRERLEELEDVRINKTLWQHFAEWERKSAKDIGCVYAALCEEAEKKNSGVSKDDLAIVMTLRQEKWKGVNDDLAECYGNLLKDLYDKDQWQFRTLIDENGHAVLPDSLTEIEECAFENCTNLLSVEIPGSVKVIYYGAFFGCTGLTSIVIPEGVEDIQECVFKGCTALKDVTLPQSLKSVSFDAFEGCPCEDAMIKECEARSIIY